MKAIVYLRVSTEQQAESGLGLEAQEAKCRAYCEALDVTVVEVIVDAGESAGSLQRPGLARVLASLDEGLADGVVVAKLDRLTRSVRDLGHLVETYFAERFSLLSVGDSIDTRSAAGRLVLNVLMSVAQWEREAIGERTRDALAAKRARGERAGTVPFGYSADDAGKLSPEPAEQAVVERVRSLRQDRGLTVREIVVQLQSEGVVSRRGTPFQRSRVAEMLSAASAA